MPAEPVVDAGTPEAARSRRRGGVPVRFADVVVERRGPRRKKEHVIFGVLAAGAPPLTTAENLERTINAAAGPVPSNCDNITIRSTAGVSTTSSRPSETGLC